jgi:hypothetical protein
MSPRLWFAYSVALVVVGVVLLALTGRAGIILIGAGLVGMFLNGRQLRR